MTSTSFVFTELANTMKYGGGFLCNLVFIEWRHCVSQNWVWGRGWYITLFSPSDVTAFHRLISRWYTGPVLSYKLRYIVGQHWPSKHETLNHCWFNVGPPSTTLAPHWINNGSMCLLGTQCWANVGPASWTVGQRWSNIRSSSAFCLEASEWSRFSYKLREIVAFGLVEMAISTNRTLACIPLWYEQFLLRQKNLLIWYLCTVVNLFTANRPCTTLVVFLQFY